MPSISAVFLSAKRKFIASDIYRITSPMYYLDKLNKWTVGYGFYGEMYERSKSGTFDWQKWTENTDIFVFPRAVGSDKTTVGALSSLFKSLKGLGKILVYELDDDLSNKYRKVHDGDMYALIEQFDMVTVTTEALKNRLIEDGVRLPIYIVPNMLQPDLWFDNPGNRKSDRLLIGLTGSPTHNQDWQVLEQSFKRLAETAKIPYDIIVMGCTPEYFKDIPNVHLLNGVDYVEYTQVIKACDIILAPVDPGDRFNNGKSPLKFIEGGGAFRLIDGYEAGAAVVASKCIVYDGYIPENCGVVVNHDSTSWYYAIYELLHDVKHRHAIQKAVYPFIKKNYNLGSNIGKWDHVYSQALKLRKEVT